MNDEYERKRSPGDVVRLKTGGPLLVVDGYIDGKDADGNEAGVQVVWFVMRAKGGHRAWFMAANEECFVAASAPAQEDFAR